MIELTYEEKLIWAAGLLDVIGSWDKLVVRNKYENYTYPRLRINKSGKEPLTRMVEIFGGSVHLRPGTKGIFSYTLQGQDALDLIEKVKPYMSDPVRTKKAE